MTEAFLSVRARRKYFKREKVGAAGAMVSRVAGAGKIAVGIIAVV